MNEPFLTRFINQMPDSHMCEKNDTADEVRPYPTIVYVNGHPSSSPSTTFGGNKSIFQQHF